MFQQRHAIAAVLLAALVVTYLSVAGAWPVAAQTSAQSEKQAASGVQARRTPVPAPARGAGPSCVAPVEWMRRNHMTVLNHQRDKTVHAGERAGPFDLKGCIACHAVKGADGHAVSVADPKHFCRSCHDYAAVSVDCFECHASRPVEPPKKAGLPDDHDIAALGRYLKGNKP